MSSTFPNGSKVFHASFGEGTVISQDASAWRVFFVRYGEKSIIIGPFLFPTAEAAVAARRTDAPRRETGRDKSSAGRQVRGKLIDLGEARPYTPKPELVRDTLPRVGIAFIGGQSGALKSFSCIHAAACIMTGEPFAGRRIERPGGIVYVAAEGEGTVEGRMVARRTLLEDPAQRLPFLVLTDLGSISNADAYKRLEAKLGEASDMLRQRYDAPLVAFIIDTVAAAGMIPEDKENDQGAWQKVFDGLKPISERLDALAVLVHHAGKTPSAGLRGSSNIRGGADAVLMLSCDRDEITGINVNHAIALTKSREAPEGPIGVIHPRPVVIGKREDGTELTSLVLDFDLGTKIVNVKRKDLRKQPRRAFSVFRSAFFDALEAEGQLQHVHGGGEGPKVKAVQLAHVRDAFSRLYVTSGADDKKRRDLLRKQFSAAVEHAISTRLVAGGTWQETEWFWPVEGNLAGLDYGEEAA